MNTNTESNIPSKLTIVETDGTGITVNFGYYVDDYELKNFTRSTRASWKGSDLFLPWDRKIINDFTKMLPELGQFGFETEAFTEAVEKNFTELKTTVKCTLTSLHNDIITCSLKPISNLLKSKLWDEKQNIKSLTDINISKVEGSLSFKVDYDEYERLIKSIGNEFRLSEYWKDREKGVSSIEVVWPTLDELDEFVEYIRMVDFKRNSSSNTLLDVSKLNLPFKPYDFQLEDAKQIVEHKRMLLGHEMGCGKTFISVLVGNSIPGKKLVIVPESLRLNWKREILNVDDTKDVVCLYSKDEFKVGNDWTIVGYRTAQKYFEELNAAWFSTMFVDEAHYCKAVNNSGEPSSSRAKAVVKLAERIDYVYLLTGTPVPTRNKDLYNLLKMLQVTELMGMSFFNYGIKYCAGENNGYGWDFNGNSNQERLNKMLGKYMVRRVKAEVLPDLKKQRQFIPLKISSKKYFGIEKKLSETEDGDTFLGLCQTGRRVLSSIKAKECMDFAETLIEAGESVVIVSEFNDTIDILEEKFKGNCCKIVGGMNDKAKQQAIDDFQAGKYPVCIINMMAAGVGITLTKAHNMIICDFDWTPANMVQVEDRICRVGQKECCNIYYMYGENTIMDTVFVEMITEKSENIDRVVDNADNTMDLSVEAEKADVGTLKKLMDAFGCKKTKKSTRKNMIELANSMDDKLLYFKTKKDCKAYMKILKEEGCIIPWKEPKTVPFEADKIIDNPEKKAYETAKGA